MKSLRLGIAVALAALLLATVAYAAGVTRIDRLLAKEVTVTDTLDVGGALTAASLTTDAAVIAGTSMASGTSITAGTGVTATTFVNAGSFVKSGSYTEVGTLLKLTAATSVTVTNGVAFAISSAWQPITAAGTVTPTITIPAAGVRACIVNNSNQTVNIADSGNQILTAAFAMGQYDVLCGHSDGTRFIEISRANN